MVRLAFLKVSLNYLIVSSFPLFLSIILTPPTWFTEFYMDGKMIAEKRKEKWLTQDALGAMIGIFGKTFFKMEVRAGAARRGIHGSPHRLARFTGRTGDVSWRQRLSLMP